MTDKMDITAKAENGRALMAIKGTIAGWRDTERNFTATVDGLIESGVKDAHLYINSPGGDCFEANEIVNVIKRFPGKITGEGGAMVASAATYIAIHCASFTMPENGLFMIHQPRGSASGRQAEIESYLALLGKMSQTYYEAYKARTTMPEKELKAKWEAGDFWMNAREAKEYGFATAIGGKTPITEATALMISEAGYNGPVAITENKKDTHLKKEFEMDLNGLLGQFGLAAGTTENQFIETVGEWKRKAERVEMLEKKEEERQNAEIEAMLNQAVLDKKITADVKEQWKEVLISNFDNGKKMLEALKPVEKPKINTPSASPADLNGKTFEQLQDENPEALAQMEKEDPEHFRKLFEDYKKRNNL